MRGQLERTLNPVAPSPGAVRLLLEHGADIAVNGDGKTALQVVGKIASR